jgi:D-alanyl-D-alanine dipeptidase
MARPPVMAWVGRALTVAALALALDAAAATPAEQSLQAIAHDPAFVEIKDGPGVAVSLRYATSDNFVHADVYGAFTHAYLRRAGAAELAAAVAILEREHPGWKLLIWDALRPRSVQRIFWAKVVGTPQQDYVANPDTGSIHNFGLAVDLTLLDASGHQLDMGTGFDAFTDVARTDHEEALVTSGRLSEAEEANRLILRGLMTRAGFRTILEEWWHFDALPPAEVKAHYQIVE